MKHLDCCTSQSWTTSLPVHHSIKVTVSLNLFLKTPNLCFIAFINTKYKRKEMCLVLSASPNSWPPTTIPVFLTKPISLLKGKTVLNQIHSFSKNGQLLIQPNCKFLMPSSCSPSTGIKVNRPNFSAFPWPLSILLLNNWVPFRHIADQHETANFDIRKEKPTLCTRALDQSFASPIKMSSETKVTFTRSG